MLDTWLSGFGIAAPVRELPASQGNLKSVSMRLRNILFCPYFKGQMKASMPGLAVASQVNETEIRRYRDAAPARPNRGFPSQNEMARISKTLDALEAGNLIVTKFNRNITVIRLKEKLSYLPSVTHWRNWKLNCRCARCGSIRIVPAAVQDDLCMICISCHPPDLWDTVGAKPTEENLILRELRNRKLI